MGFNPSSKDFFNTKRVWGIGPSAASTSNNTESIERRTRSTSEPKSACPGVSTIFIFVPLYVMDAFFEYIVIPRSCSSASESMLTSLSVAPVCRKIASVSVVFPWSTWAIIAMFLISIIFFNKKSPRKYKEITMFRVTAKPQITFIVLPPR